MRLALVAALVSLTAPSVCRYTVRDIGFVDLDGAEYTLSLVAPAEELAAARELVAALDPGPESNVRIALLDPKSEPDNPAVQERGGQPHGWVLQRDGLAPLPLGVEVRGPDRGAQRAVDAVLGGERATGLARDATSTFIYALLLRGADADANQAAADVVAHATRRLEEIESQLPRPVEWPVRTIDVPFAERQQEAVLAWSLGLAVFDERPALALVYGRGKLAGKVMVGGDIDAREVLTQMALVGESCECETERTWAEEPRIPLRWTDAHRKDAAATLGFEPDSPMVRSEVARILAKVPKPSGDQPVDALEALLLGYRETELVTGGPGARGASGDGTEPGARDTGLTVIEAGDGDWGFEDEGSASAGAVQGTPAAGSQSTGGTAEAQETPAELAESMARRTMWIAYVLLACLLLAVLLVGVLLVKNRHKEA